MSSRDKSLVKVEQIRAIAQNLGFQPQVTEYTDGFRFFFRSLPLASITMGLDFISESETGEIWFSIHSSSWTFHGERTDIHEVVSVFLALFFRVSPIGTSSRLVTVVNEFSRIDVEIYTRYLILEQPNVSCFPINEYGLEKIDELLLSIRVFEKLFYETFYCPVCDVASQLLLDAIPEVKIPTLYNYPIAEDWARKIALLTGDDFDSGSIQYNFRHQPSWRYFRSIDSKISVVLMPKAVRWLFSAAQGNKLWKCLDGSSRKLFVSNDVNNAISLSHLRKAKRILGELEKDIASKDDFLVIPLENQFVVIGTIHLIIVERNCGKREFIQEREKIRQRHVQEEQTLFPILSFNWSENINGEEFEVLIREILSREHGVKWLRQVSAGNEPDGGRDLIAEWMTPPLPGEFVRTQESPYSTRRIIVQCKAYKARVGKSDVTDIRDTIEHNSAGGYFLVVSSSLRRSLTEHLEKLRNGGQYWVDWWTRNEIEDRLRVHPDIVSKFPNIVQINRLP
jgi:Restriction endonuclease